MTIHFTANGRGKPPDYHEIDYSATPWRKLADAVLRFDHEDGPLRGHDLHGFVVWGCTFDGERKLNVTPPERQLMGGANRGQTYAMLRPVGVLEDTFRPRLSLHFKLWVIEQFKAWDSDPANFPEPPIPSDL